MFSREAMTPPIISEEVASKPKRKAVSIMLDIKIIMIDDKSKK
jgi:hypothetical protein